MSSKSLIPIENIYYLYCYAWNKFEETNKVPVAGEKCSDLPNLLARVLLWAIQRLLRRGLDQSYKTHIEEISTVRGRINLINSMRLGARNIRRLNCEFDELTHDNHANRILKASLLRLSKAPMIDTSIFKQLRNVANRMSYVSDVKLGRSDFSRVFLHKNLSHYYFPLKVAELAFDCFLPDLNGNDMAFNDITQDERKMALVFEAFVRNFIRIEQSEFKVEPLSIQWDAEVLLSKQVGKLPNMIADVYLQNSERKIIIDTKYYANSLQNNRGTEGFHSANLYQLFSYLKNSAGNNPDFKGVEGMLLYPQVDKKLRESFIIQGHNVMVATLNLAQPWQNVADELLSLIETKKSAVH